MSEFKIITSEEEIKVEIKSEIILPDVHTTEVLGNYEYVEEVTQREDVKIEYVEIKQEEIEYEKNVKIEFVDVKPGDGDDLADKSYKGEDDENQNETYSDNFTSKPRGKYTNPHIEKDDSTPTKRKNKKLGKTKSKPGYYECKKCFEKFPDFKGLKKHQEEVKHPPNVYNNPSSCPVCSKIIGYRSMWQHMKMHTGEKPYSCEICGDSFRVSCHLTRHKLARHSEPNDQMHQCEACNKSFKRLDLLKNHQKREKKADKMWSRGSQCSKIHTCERPHACDLCGKTFNRLDHLKNHKLIHTGEKPHICSVCNQAYTQSNSLNEHMRKHTGEKPSSCEICNKTFTRPYSLKNHMKLHTGEKPYTCEICSKACMRSDQLKLHMRIHTGEKPHICSICNKAYSHTTTLKYHMRIHTDENFIPVESAATANM